jgi:hypothetical protein
MACSELDGLRLKIQRKNDPGPCMIEPTPQDVVGSDENMCNVNCKKYRNKKGTKKVKIKILKGFKIFACEHGGKIVGMKAVVHFIVSHPKNGKKSPPDLISPTPETDKMILFVPSTSLYNDYEGPREKLLLEDGVRLGGVILWGTDEYRNAIATLEGPRYAESAQKIKLIHAPKPITIELVP